MPAQFDQMSLAFLVNPEARLLVAAWPLLVAAWPKVPADLKKRRCRRAWAALAGVREVAVDLFGHQLLEARIVLPGGRVEDSVRQFVTTRAVLALAPGIKR